MVEWEPAEEAPTRLDELTSADAETAPASDDHHRFLPHMSRCARNHTSSYPAWTDACLGLLQIPDPPRPPGRVRSSTRSVENRRASVSSSLTAAILYNSLLSKDTMVSRLS